MVALLSSGAAEWAFPHPGPLPEGEGEERAAVGYLSSVLSGEKGQLRVDKAAPLSTLRLKGIADRLPSPKREEDE